MSVGTVYTRAEARAKELATYQCDVDEIVAVLCDELHWTEAQACEWCTTNAELISRARLVARAELRRDIWETARGSMPGEWSSPRFEFARELARQCLGWVKATGDTPIEQLAKALNAAIKQRDKAPKRGPTGVAA
jgi:hypothetical protein